MKFGDYHGIDIVVDDHLIPGVVVQSNWKML